MPAVRRRRLRPLLAAVPLALAVAAATAPAQAPPAAVAGADPCSPPTDPPAALNATTNRTGVVDLMLNDVPRDAVTFYECLGARAIRLGVRAAPDHGITVFGGAVPWSCTRRVRAFSAETTLPGGALSRGRFTVTTPSCAARFTVAAPATVRPGRSVRVRIADGWLTGGIATRLCVTPPRGRASCRAVAFPAGRTAAVRRFRPRARGRWTVTLTVAGHHVRALVGVGVPAPSRPARPVVIATGDSTIHGVDSALAKELRGEATVVGDMHPGFAMSLANSWLPIARAQIAAHDPAAVVVSMGAAEGFPMKGADGITHSCCDEPWIAEYARRVRQVMTLYSRGGRTQVFYETIFASRPPARQRIVAAVDAAILRAAEGLPDVTVLRADLLFSPNGYQESIVDGGRTVVVRKPDGIHLNPAGTAIEAREAAKAIRAAWRRAGAAQTPPGRR